MFSNPSKLKVDAQQIFLFLEEHYKILPKLPVQPDVKPGFLRHQLSTSAPIEPKNIEQIINEIDQKLVPGMTNWHHPNFYAYFPGEATHAAILGDILATSFNNPNFSWQVSPTATELENIICDWIVQMLGLPDQFLFKNQGGGTIINSVTEAYFSSVNAAKYKKCQELDIKYGDVRIFKLVAYYPESSQFWCQKALFIKEIQNQRMLPMEYNSENMIYQINIQNLQNQIEDDIKNGFIPFWFGASIGGTAVGTTDDINSIGQICQKYKIFLNVDAAYKGTQWVCPELREQTDGLKYVDAIQINFAKNMMMGMNGCTMFVKDRENLMESHGKLLQKNEIYQNQFNGQFDIVDYKDWTVGFGKRFNSMKFFVVFNYFGIEGMQQYVRCKIDMSKYFLQQISSYEYFEFPIRRELGLVCFRLKSFQKKNKNEMIEINRQLLKNVNSLNPQDGFISGTLFAGQYLLRFIANNSNGSYESIDLFIKKLILCSENLVRLRIEDN